MDELSDALWKLVDDCPSLCMNDALFLSIGKVPSDKARTNLDQYYLWQGTPKSQRIRRDKLAGLIGGKEADELIARRNSASRWSCVKADGALLTYTDSTLTETGAASGYNYGNCHVQVADFAAFCRRQEWDVPARLARYAVNGELLTRGVTKQWPWGPYETELLRQLAAAARRYWVNFDPSDPTTAPTNEEVANFLTGRGVASRVAETMAQMLRADGLRPGPRPGNRAKN